MLSIIDTRNRVQISKFARELEISYYMSGDVILKQGIRNNTFYFIHQGETEVVMEKQDYEFYNFAEVAKYFEDSAQAKQTFEINKIVPADTRISALKVTEENKYDSLVKSNHSNSSKRLVNYDDSARAPPTVKEDNWIRTTHNNFFERENDIYTDSEINPFRQSLNGLRVSKETQNFGLKNQHEELKDKSLQTK